MRVRLIVKMISLFTVLVAFSAAAQPTPPNPLGQRPPGSTPTPVPTSPPAVPSAPLASTPAIPVTNAFTGATNLFAGTNFSSGELPAALGTLQNNLNQALPLLAAFNAAILGGQSMEGATTPARLKTSGGAVNFAQNFATSSAANLSANLAANVATPTTPNTVGTPALAPPPTGVTNALGLSTSFGGGGGAGTNITGQTVSPDTVRLLLGLQNDMERMLSELAAFTGGNVALPSTLNSLNTSTMTPGAFVTNQFVFPRTTTPATRVPTPQRLTPTGR